MHTVRLYYTDQLVNHVWGKDDYTHTVKPYEIYRLCGQNAEILIVKARGTLFSTAVWVLSCSSGVGKTVRPHDRRIWSITGITYRGNFSVPWQTCPSASSSTINPTDFAATEPRAPRWQANVKQPMPRQEQIKRYMLLSNYHIFGVPVTYMRRLDCRYTNV